MKKLYTIAFATVLMFGLSMGLFAQASKSAAVKSIDAYCKTVDAISKKHNKGPEMVFADTSDYEDANSKSKWQKFTSENALEKFRETTETYSIAFNWLKDRKIVASNFTNSSPSGDWAMYIYHCYRADGTLARVTSELRTFYGDYIITQTRYFSGRGKQISKKAKYQDLTTHKPKKSSADNDRYFTDDDIFRTTAKLPFAHLLRKK